MLALALVAVIGGGLAWLATSGAPEAGRALREGKLKYLARKLRDKSLTWREAEDGAVLARKAGLPKLESGFKEASRRLRPKKEK